MGVRLRGAGISAAIGPSRLLCGQNMSSRPLPPCHLRSLFGPELPGGARRGPPLGRWVQPWDDVPLACAEGVVTSSPRLERD
jgi:hypothetical protein